MGLGDRDRYLRHDSLKESHNRWEDIRSLFRSQCRAAVLCEPAWKGRLDAIQAPDSVPLDSLSQRAANVQGGECNTQTRISGNSSQIKRPFRSWILGVLRVRTPSSAGRFERQIPE